MVEQTAHWERLFSSRAMTLSTVHDIIQQRFGNTNQNILFFLNLEIALLLFWCILVITPLPMAHQQTNLLIVSEFNQILQINISNEIFFFFLYQFFVFSFIHYFHFYRQYGDWKKTDFFVRFWTFKNNPKTSTVKCHHNQIHELYSCFFIVAASLIKSLFVGLAVSNTSNIPV